SGNTLAMAEYAVADILHFAKGLHRASSATRPKWHWLFSQARLKCVVPCQCRSQATWPPSINQHPSQAALAPFVRSRYLSSTGQASRPERRRASALLLFVGGSSFAQIQQRRRLAGTRACPWASSCRWPSCALFTTLLKDRQQTFVEERICQVHVSLLASNFNLRIQLSKRGALNAGNCNRSNRWVHNSDTVFASGLPTEGVKRRDDGGNLYNSLGHHAAARHFVDRAEPSRAPYAGHAAGSDGARFRVRGLRRDSAGTSSVRVHRERGRRGCREWPGRHQRLWPRRHGCW